MNFVKKNFWIVVGCALLAFVVLPQDIVRSSVSTELDIQANSLRREINTLEQKLRDAQDKVRSLIERKSHPLEVRRKEDIVKDLQQKVESLQKKLGKIEDEQMRAVLDEEKMRSQERKNLEPRGEDGLRQRIDELERELGNQVRDENYRQENRIRREITDLENDLRRVEGEIGELIRNKAQPFEVEEREGEADNFRKEIDLRKKGMIRIMDR